MLLRRRLVADLIIKRRCGLKRNRPKFFALVGGIYAASGKMWSTAQCPKAPTPLILCLLAKALIFPRK